MEVYRRPRSPFWWFDATIDGRRLRRSTRLPAEGARSVTRREAERAADQQAHAAAQTIAEASQALSLGDATLAYVKRLQAASKASAGNAGTLRDKLHGLRPEFRDRFKLPASLPLVEVSPIHMENLVQARLAEGNSPQTIKHELGMIRASVRDAASLGYKVPQAMTSGLVRNPWRIPTITQKTRYLSWAEFTAVYDRLSPDREIVRRTRAGGVSATYRPQGKTRDACQASQDLMVALTMTGGRWSEVKSLRWDQVDLARGVVRVFGTKVMEGRLVPLPAQFREVFERRHAARAPGSVLIFPNKDGEERGASSRAIGRAMEACGLNTPALVARYGRATPHSLRHTFASWVSQNGGTMQELQGALGHASPATTQRYSHLQQASTAVRLGGLLERVHEKPVLRTTHREAE